MKKTDIFFPCSDMAAGNEFLAQLAGEKHVGNVFMLVGSDFPSCHQAPDGCRFLIVDDLMSSATMCAIAHATTSDYALLVLRETRLTLGQHAVDRLLCAAEATDAEMVYSDYYKICNHELQRNPVIDYFAGSLRDDFDFGGAVLVSAAGLHAYADSQPSASRYAGFYDLRLSLSRRGQLFHLNEFLYTIEEYDLRESGVKQFDYVDARNRNVQIEMEQAVSRHLSEIGATVSAVNRQNVDFNACHFDVEASVVIPVYNRERTICDAVDSALSQKTTFRYNVIVVDNHSTDNTTSLQWGGGMFWDNFRFLGSTFEESVETTKNTIETGVENDPKNYFKADTLEELADLIGVDKENFLATVEHYNELVDAGEDTDFYKDTVFLTPIKEGPFYATRVGAGLLAVVGGLHIDDNNQVLTAEDEPIPGLFAVGNVSGDMYAVDYPINFMGNSHARCLVGGYCVGTYLANL